MSKTIRESKVQLIEFARRTWFAVIEHGHTIDDIQAPDYWKYKVSLFTVGDIIEFKNEDNTCYGRLFVHRKNEFEVHVKVLEFHDFNKADKKPVNINKSEYYTKFRGPVAKWCAMKGDTSIQDGFNSKEDAQAHCDKLSEELAA